jgi:hypothetical protein
MKYVVTCDRHSHIHVEWDTREAAEEHLVWVQQVSMSGCTYRIVEEPA